MSDGLVFIHSSDFQLGMTRWFLNEEAQSRFDDSRLRAITRLGDLAVKTGAEFIVVAGDVFDANALSERTMGRALDAIDALPVPVYLLPGNHDPLVPGAAMEKADERANIAVLRDSTPVEHRPGVEIVGAPLLARYASEDLASKAIAGLEPTSSIRILVAHGQTEGRSGDESEVLLSLPKMERALKDGVIDYVALGGYPLRRSRRLQRPDLVLWFAGDHELS